MVLSVISSDSSNICGDLAIFELSPLERVVWSKILKYYTPAVQLREALHLGRSTMRSFLVYVR